MSRCERHTEPIETSLGYISDYNEINRLLTEGEIRGRDWLFERAKSRSSSGLPPSDDDILDLHKEMFGHLLEWAGNTRCVDAGPGGKVPVHWTDVRSQLRNLGEDAKYRIPKSDTLTDVAEFFAWFHHRFQFIHPFRDTNGRTGRVIDLYLLWVTFDFAGDTTLTSPIIEHFPTERHQGDYYEGLDRADRHDFAVLNAFYLDRLEATFREG